MNFVYILTFKEYKIPCNDFRKVFVSAKAANDFMKGLHPEFYPISVSNNLVSWKNKIGDFII